VIGSWVARRPVEEILFQHVQEGCVLLGIDILASSLLVNGDVASPPSGSDALNFVFWFANEIVRLEEPVILRPVNMWIST
jgi:hypothetical protein